MPTIIKQLEEINASLTEETWDTGKTGYYFVFNISNKKLCFCAHGAVQYAVNPTVKRLQVLNPSADYFPVPLLPGNYTSYILPATLPTAAASYADKHCNGQYNKKTVWNNRPVWVRADSIGPDDINQGNQDISFLLGMVGLTADYNDEISTTLSDIKEKFRQAIALAHELNC